MKKITLILLSLAIVSIVLIAGCTTPTTPPATTVKPTVTASSGALWPTNTQPEPVNPCVNCKCPAISDDSKYTQEIVLDNMHGYRYMELFLKCPGQDQAGIFNTITLNIQPDDSRDSSPADLMANYSDTQVAADYGAEFAYMSGIRHWMFDKMRVTIANNVRYMDGLDTRWGADAANFVPPTGAGGSGGAEAVYIVNKVTCNRTWYYNKGTTLYILDAPDGNSYVMQSYSDIVNPNQKESDLMNLGKTLKLPTGWKFRTKVLDQDMAVNGITCDGKTNQWRVMQDDLINTYSAYWECEGQSSCTPARP
jgi:hypothetical protein